MNNFEYFEEVKQHIEEKMKLTILREYGSIKYYPIRKGKEINGKNFIGFTIEEIGTLLIFPEEGGITRYQSVNQGEVSESQEKLIKEIVQKAANAHKDIELKKLF